MLRMSPSRMTRSFDGIPCTTSSLMEAQRCAGYPIYPLKALPTPFRAMNRSANASRSHVQTPGRINGLTSSKNLATTAPARRITSISRGDFTRIIPYRRIFTIPA